MTQAQKQTRRFKIKTAENPDTPAKPNTQEDPETPAGPETPAEQEAPAENQDTSGEQVTPVETPEILRLKRKLSLLTNDNCKGLDTQDNDKYQCVVSEDQTQYVEVKKENSNNLKLSAFSIIFLFLI